VASAEAAAVEVDNNQIKDLTEEQAAVAAVAAKDTLLVLVATGVLETVVMLVMDLLEI
tara:strand:+ start:86 stop:259 length:174 start_codon:yes stop_codon:yes gene_type:complete